MIAGKVEKCTITAVEVKVGTDENTKTETYKGGLAPVIVEEDVDWNDYFAIRTISNVTYMENTACNVIDLLKENYQAENKHHIVSAYIYMPEYTGKEVTSWEVDVQTKEGDSGAWVEWIHTNPYRDIQYENDMDSITLDPDVGYYDVKFQHRFGMVDGVSPTGIYVRFAKEYDITYNLEGGEFAEESVKTYVAGSEVTLECPTKDGYFFAGWTGPGYKEPTRDAKVSKETVGDLTFTANWTKIKKGVVQVVTAPVATAIEEGKKLSDSQLTGGKAVDENGKEIKGTWSWKNDTVVPTLADSDVTKYTVIFTPDNANYETVEASVVVTVNKKQAEITVQLGEEQKDKDKKATYTVTEIADGQVEVRYVAPAKKEKKVTIPASVTLADGTKAEVTAVEAGAFKNNTKVQTVTIGRNVTSIGKEAFKGCKNLKKVKSAKNVEKIGKEAFANCTNLTSVAMCDDVTSIGEKAFYNCKELKKITIGKKVTSIGKSAFQKCKSLKTITIQTKNLTKKKVGKNAFKGIYSKAKIDVPKGKVKAYKSILKARGVSKKATIK